MGYGYNTGPELEFFLLKPGPNGELQPLSVHDAASYFDVSSDLAHTVRRQMVERCSNSASMSRRRIMR